MKFNIKILANHKSVDVLLPLSFSHNRIGIAYDKLNGVIYVAADDDEGTKVHVNGVQKRAKFGKKKWAKDLAHGVYKGEVEWIGGCTLKIHEPLKIIEPEKPVKKEIKLNTYIILDGNNDHVGGGIFESDKAAIEKMGQDFELESGSRILRVIAKTETKFVEV